MAPARQLDTAWVIEDDGRLRGTIEGAIAPRFKEVRGMPGVAACQAALRDSPPPDVVLLDVELVDGSAFEVLRLLVPLETAPVVIAISGTSDAKQSFALAQLGVRAYLPKPLDLATLEAAIDWAAATGPDLIPQLRAAVGHRPIHEVEEEVRTTMLREALAQAHGSRRRAARLLCVSRQLVQHMLRRAALD